MSGQLFPRVFVGYRPVPPADYAGLGLTNGGRRPDYEGAVFTDGTVVLHWAAGVRSHSVWASFADFYHVHGHPEYGTVIIFADGNGPPASADWPGSSPAQPREVSA